jgi:hypothetical protein
MHGVRDAPAAADDYDDTDEKFQISADNELFCDIKTRNLISQF